MPFWYRRRWRRGWAPWAARRRNRRVARRRYPRAAGRRRRRRRYRVRRCQRRRRARRGRRRRFRRKRLTLTLKRWNPTTMRHLQIKGLFPALLCGKTRQQFNYIQWSDTVPPAGTAFGGGFAVARFSLAVLFQEHQRNRNVWTKSNCQLDLIRYLRCSFRLYRHPVRDYIFQYSLESPMESDISTHPNTHPMRMIMMRHHKTVPSLKTKPFGKRYIKVKIKPPKLMYNNWYFQKDFCNVGLVLIKLCGCSLQNPWIRPSTDTPCLNIQVLDSDWSDLSISAEKKDSRKQVFDRLWANPQYIYSPPTANMWDSLKSNNNDKEFNFENIKKSIDGIPEKVRTTIYKNFEKEVDAIDSNYYSNQLNKVHDYTLARLTGIYSPSLLTWRRYNIYTSTAFTMARYNPHVDQGKGNKIWIQPLTKSSSTFNPQQCKCAIFDAPLWLGFFGYIDWCRKATKDPDVENNWMILITTPYTIPKF